RGPAWAGVSWPVTLRWRWTSPVTRWNSTMPNSAPGRCRASSAGPTAPPPRRGPCLIAPGRGTGEARMDIDLSVLRSLESEKDISMDLAIKAIEDALLVAYHKSGDSAATARVEVDRRTGHV